MRSQSYRDKPSTYFSNARLDYVRKLPLHARVLEVGCGSGATGAVALAHGAASYCGIEVEALAATAAAAAITEVVTGDVETVELPWSPDSFDVLIMSEVLEHLRDPWSVLTRLKPLLAPGAKVFASSPNVAHHRMIRMQLRGEWALESSGPMDATHLRWFTPKSYADMFTACGYAVDSVRPVGGLSAKQKLAARITRRPHLFFYQIDLEGHRP